MLAVKRSEMVIIVQNATRQFQLWHWGRFLEELLLALVVVMLPYFVDILHVIIVVLDFLVVPEGVLQSGKTIVLFQLLFVVLEPHRRRLVARRLLFLLQMLHLLHYLLLGLSPRHDLVKLHLAPIVIKLEKDVNFSIILVLIDVVLVLKAARVVRVLFVVALSSRWV